MANALDGNLRTPIGSFPKKTVLLAGGFIAVLAAIVYYRSSKGTGSSDGTISESSINPATGYPFGSAEDAAAMAAQGNYLNPAQPYNPGSGSGTYPVNEPGSFTNNAAWSQYVINYFDDNGLVENTSALSAAIAKYLAGQAVGRGSNDESLINQAIAVGGKPPIAGSNGYPPSINTENTPVTPLPDIPTTAPTIRVDGVGRTNASLTWTAVPGVTAYQLYSNKNVRLWSGEGTHLDWGNLHPNGQYGFKVRALGRKGAGPFSNTVIAKTTK